MSAAIRSIRSGLSRVRLVNLRELRSHPLRMWATLGVVVIASALLVAVLGAFGSLTDAVRQSNAAISGGADVEVTGITDTGIDADLAGRIRELPDVKTAAPLIRGSVVIDGATVALIGSDHRLTALSPQLRATMSAESQSVNLDDLGDGIIAGPGIGLTKGQRLTIGGVDVKVLAIADGAAAMLNHGAVVFAYLPLAQQITDHDGLVDTILVAARPDADETRMRASITRILDGRAVLVDPDFRTAQAATAGATTRDATLLVSLVALVIAAFLVFNTMTMAVAARRSSLAMIRALGARRTHLAGDLVTESILLGIIGGLIGVPLGIAGGRWAIGRLTGPTDDLTSVVPYHLPAYAVPVAVGASVLACLLPAVLAARSVYAMAPLEAMSSGGGHDAPDVRRRRWPSGIVGAALVLAAWLIAVGVESRAVVVAGAVYVVGALALCYFAAPVVARMVRAVAQHLAGPGRLAAVNAERAPQRTWATVMTVVVAVAVGMGTSGALDNMVTSLSGSLDGFGDPDFYVSASDPGATPTGPVLSAQLKPAVERVAGVTDVVGMQWAAVNVGEARILVQGLDRRTQAPFMKKATPEAITRVLADDGIILATGLARTLGVRTGDRLTLATPSGAKSLVVRDTVDYLTIASGTAAISGNLLREWFHRPGDTYLQVSVAAGADRLRIRHDLERIASTTPPTGGARANVYSGADAMAATEAAVRKAGAFTMAIQWIVAVAAAVALLNTLLLSVLDRRRDLGVLRALGASRRFVSRMVVAEAVAMAVVGCGLGIVVGLPLHLIADRTLTAMTAVDVHYSPRPAALVVVLVASTLCVVGASIPARRAARMNISKAILAD